MDEHIRFIDAKPNPYTYMSMCDIFMLPSREDSFGLVGLEAASLGKPVLCFAGGGGMQEFVEEDAGVVVPYLRTDLMAQAVVSLQQNAAKRLTLGSQAAKKVREQHAVEIILPQIDVLLHELLQTEA
jgi:glycosyltransferase involved in cell wall biosynthesis